jgi:protein-S-isoprenylcysteine O-methyltransferase Ste14
MDTNGARASTTPGESEPSPAEALRRLQQQVGELQAYVTHFVSAKIDGFVLSARQLALWAALGVMGLTALVGLVVTAIVLALVGAANGFALLFGGRWWLGQVVVGGGTIVLLVVSLLMGMRIWQNRSRQQKVQQYDERQLQQHATFGHSVADRATEETALRHQ